MARTVQLTVAAEHTDALLADVRRLDPHGIRLHRGASVHPPGDVIVIEVSNAGLRDVMRVADAHDLGRSGGVSLTTSEPLSLVTHGYTSTAREEGGTTWEELELAMSQDSTMTSDRLVVMLIAGAIAAFGIVSGAVHVVVGAMIIAPGFQPFGRFVLGLINRTAAWRGGLLDVLRGYTAVAAGATLAALVSRGLGASALDSGHPSYLGADALVAYWSTLTWAGVAVGGAAAICGGLLLAINRTVLTAGVMVALALIPSAALAPMAVVAGDLALAGRAVLRFSAEAALVVAGSSVVFVTKRFQDHREITD